MATFRLSRPPNGDFPNRAQRSREITENPPNNATDRTALHPIPNSASFITPREARSQELSGLLPREFKERMCSIIGRSPNPQRCVRIMQSRFDDLLRPAH
jgi:hypothetical protein